MAFTHPGEDFASVYPLPETQEQYHGTVRAYVEFLREVSGVGDHAPVDLELIFKHFGIKVALGSTDSTIHGIANTQMGMVVVNADEWATRQRFAQAHELVEFLFDSLRRRVRSSRIRDVLRGPKKERLCDRGASWLLLPPEKLAADMAGLELTFASASSIASRYNTSLMAAAIGMLDHMEEGHVLALWHRQLKPTQRKNVKAEIELCFGEEFVSGPVPKMRLEWAFTSPSLSNQYFPPKISVPENSVIAIADQNRLWATGHEYMNIKGVKGNVSVEGMPVTVGQTGGVLSLLRMDPAVAPVVRA